MDANLPKENVKCSSRYKRLIKVLITLLLVCNVVIIIIGEIIKLNKTEG